MSVTILTTASRSEAAAVRSAALHGVVRSMRRGVAEVLLAGGGGGGINSESRDITGRPNSRTNTSVAIKKGTYVRKLSSDAAIYERARVACPIERAREHTTMMNGA
jgi:hypothetical protein